MPKIDDKWSLMNIPPKGHKAVADFAFGLFEIARIEKERLGKPGDFLSNYALYRGKQSSGANVTAAKAYTPVNLYFANIERTVSNITARNPVGEVVDLDGRDDGAEEIFTVKLKKWWKDSGQQTKTRTSARGMEIYGITPEKPFWDKERSEPDIMVTDPFGFFPAPGNWDDISTEAPFVCFPYLDFVDKIEKDFDVKGVAQEDAYELLGVEREKYKADNYQVAQQRIGNYDDPMTRVSKTDKAASDKKIKRGLIIEVWVRDTRIRTVKEDLPPEVDDQGGFHTAIPLTDDQGRPVIEQVVRKEPVYPDGIRKITITKRDQGKKSKTRDTDSEYMVLDDSANPNINPALEIEFASETHPWGRFPVYTANSYKDLVSIWGFAAAEQVGDLVVKINQIVSKLISYVINVMAPPLIVQQHCGITRAMIESQLGAEGRLVLMPTTPNARIEFMQIPNLPATFFQVLELIIRLFDRVYQIEDADRGQAPKGVIAASAIVALQERNQIMMQAKTSAIDMLAEQRSRWAIGLWQNFGTKTELVDVSGEATEFIGTRYAGRKFSYVIEAGSTTPRTSLQIEEISKALYDEGVIDQQARLEAVNFPDWKAIVMRMQAPMFEQLLQFLFDMGMPEEEVMQVQEFIEKEQKALGGGMSNQDKGSKGPKPGTPKAKQGKGGGK